MDEPSLVSRGDRKLKVVVRRRSDERFWSGFDARLYDVVASGFAQVRPLPKHSLSMLVGTPIATSCRCGGLAVKRLQEPGDVDVIPAGFPSTWEDGAPTTFIDVNLSPSLVRATADAMGLGSERASIEPQLSLKDPQISHVVWALAAELERNEPVGRLYADSLGVALAAHLLRRYAPAAPRPPERLSKRRLQWVVEYIADHLASDLSLDELAQVAHMSPSHFKATFKESVGLPVHQYVVRRRVEYAADLIARGTHALSDVALQAGFANQSHMARWMKRVTGVTPTLLRIS
jgi:AraC family transcriptional regulator